MVELTEDDKKQLEERGIGEEKFNQQLNLIKRGVPYINLVKPCKVGDGIRVLSDHEVNEYERLFDNSLIKYKPVKFVPSSGAASRMFGLLNKIRLDYEGFEKRLAENNINEDDKKFLEFTERIEEFAFFDDLNDAIKQKGENIRELIISGKFDKLLDFVLTDKGLDYSNYPKGLIKFHKYAGHNRVAFEEHLVEALNYSTDGTGVSTVHFTILEEHKTNKLYG